MPHSTASLPVRRRRRQRINHRRPFGTAAAIGLAGRQQGHAPTPSVASPRLSDPLVAAATSAAADGRGMRVYGSEPAVPHPLLPLGSLLYHELKFGAASRVADRSDARCLLTAVQPATAKPRLGG